MTSDKVEEIVDRLMDSWGTCDLQYRSENDKVESELREALTQYHQDLMSEVVEMKKEKPKGKCMNLENHLYGSCFECKKIEGYNQAIDDIVKSK